MDAEHYLTASEFALVLAFLTGPVCLVAALPLWLCLRRRVGTSRVGAAVGTVVGLTLIVALTLALWAWVPMEVLPARVDALPLFPVVAGVVVIAVYFLLPRRSARDPAV